MIRDVAYFLIFGKPLIFYTGILTFLSFLFTALIGFLNHNGIHKIPFKWHPRMAVISIALAIIHALMGIFTYI